MCSDGKAKAVGLISEDKSDEAKDGNQYGDAGDEGKPDPIARAVSMQMRGMSDMEDDAADQAVLTCNDGIDTSSSSAEVSPSTKPATRSAEISNNNSEMGSSDEAVANTPSTPYHKPLTHLQAAALRDALDTPLPRAGSTPVNTPATADTYTTTQPPSYSNPFPRLTKEALQHAQFAKAPPGNFEHPIPRAWRARSSTPTSRQTPAAKPVKDALEAANVSPAHLNPPRRDGGVIFSRNDDITERNPGTANTRETKSTAITEPSAEYRGTAEEGKGEGKKDS